MEVVIKNALGTVVVLWSATFAMQVQEVANPVPVNSAVSAVTVYADRTRVTRKTSVELKAGTQILEFSRLPGWIDENSVRIAVQPSDAALTPDIS